MSVRSESVPVAGVCSSDTAIKSNVIALASQLGLEGLNLSEQSALEQLLAIPAVAALVYHLDCLTEPASGSSANLAQLLAYIPRFKQQHPAGQVILLTSGQLSLAQTCKAAANGICAIVPLEQPDFSQRLTDHLRSILQHFLKKRQSQHQTATGADRNGLVGKSAALNQVIDQARQAATISDAPVVIYGQSGTGKQKIAELIHQWDPKRHDHPFISVNCAAITGSLAESELFGHTKGAFTGATEDRLGYFRAANHGTILLDEISELSQALQPKILRVLQEGLVLPVGSDKEHLVDVRVLAATNRDLYKMVDEAKFRLDLLERLSVIQLMVPTLRQRSEDIPELFRAFLLRYAHYCRQEITAVDPDVYQILAHSIGAGNIRELENLVRQILVFKEQGHRIEITDLPQKLLTNGFGPSDVSVGLDVPDELIEALLTGRKRLASVIDDYEREMLKRLVDRGVNNSVLADRLGITRRTLYNKLQKHDIR